MSALEHLERAAERVHAFVPPTPQIAWPLLCERAGTDVVVKHENHTALGAFKLRGGALFVEQLLDSQPDVLGVIAATRGNHGQSVAFAARRAGLRAVVVVPHGNSLEKNAAMRAHGAELVEHGRDFQASLEHAEKLATAEGLAFFPSFAEPLVDGIASYALEWFRAYGDLHTVYVPIGMGSGICAVIAARDALGLATRVVGVVSEGAPTHALSFAAGHPVPTATAETMADGLATRSPPADAVARIHTGAERIVPVSDASIEAAMRHYFTDTHNVAEGAGAAPLAALLSEAEAMRGRRVGVVLSGGNVDRDVFARVLAGGG